MERKINLKENDKCILFVMESSTPEIVLDSITKQVSHFNCL